MKQLNQEYVLRSEQLQNELKSYDFATIKDQINKQKGFAESQKQEAEKAVKSLKELIAGFTPEMLTQAEVVSPGFTELLQIDFDRAREDCAYVVERQEALVAAVRSFHDRLQGEIDVQYTSSRH